MGHAQPRCLVVRLEIVGLPSGVETQPGFGVGDSVDDEKLLQGAYVIRQELVDQGYLQARVEFDTGSDSLGLLVWYRVDAETQARVQAWHMTGNHNLDSQKLLRAMPGKGAVFSKKTLERAVYAILNSYQNKGFPFAEVVPVSVADSGGAVEPRLLVNEGPLVRVGYLAFTGGSGLPHRVLTRVARFRPGVRYSPAVVRSWRRNLELSGLVRVDGEDLVAGQGYGVRFAVTERRSNRAWAAVGYAPDPAPRFTGLVELGLGNILNTGRKTRAGWQSFHDRTVYHLSYTEPWVFGWWLSLTGAAKHRVTDTTRSETSFSVEAELLTSPDFSVGFETGFEQVAGIDTSNNGRTVWAGTGFKADIRDTDFNPRQGGFLNLKTRAGQRTARTGNGEFVGRFEADFGVIGPAFGRLVWANLVHYRLVHSESLPEFEWYRMGGAASLRGYQEEEFSGTQAGWWSCEMRYGLGTSTMAYPFLDAGVARTTQGWVFKPAYGVGLRTVTKLGILGFDYGVAVGDNPLRGKVHLKFAAEF